MTPETHRQAEIMSKNSQRLKRGNIVLKYGNLLCPVNGLLFWEVGTQLPSQQQAYQRMHSPLKNYHLIVKDNFLKERRQLLENYKFLLTWSVKLIWRREFYSKYFLKSLIHIYTSKRGSEVDLNDLRTKVTIMNVRNKCGDLENDPNFTS